VETSRIPPPQAQPLQGIRVVEVGLYHAGPTASGMLAALGAEVVKVEDPRSPDPSRAVRRLYGQDCLLDGGRSVAFEVYNASKLGVTLNLKHAEGQRLLQGLVARSDVFLHNMRADTAARLRIDFDSLLQHNARLVYAAISGFGPQGPDAARPGLDPVGLARSGMMTALSGGSQRPPVLPAISVSDRAAGMVMGYGILAALLARDRSGQPQRVDGSLLGATMWLGELNLQYALFTGRELLPNDHQGDPVFNSYACADGRWIYIAALSPEGWLGLCRGLGLAELASDPRFENAEARWAQRAQLAQILRTRFATRDSEQWMAALAAQPALVFERVNRPQDVGSDAQVLANGYVVEHDDPALGRVRRVAFPLHVNGQAAGRVGPAPALGEHNAQVFGLPASELEALRAQGVL
jgi:crotonobetainyl-CoA:carnitine CoA-transferase CaiB-like acyl-CoA transferase